MKTVALGIVALGFGVMGAGAKAQAPTTVYVPSGGSTSHPTKMANRPTGVNSPVPVGLLNARKVFISNAGADAGLFPHPFTGTQDRAYAYFYKAIAAGKRFEIVGSPADADVVMQIELLAPEGSLGESKQKGTGDPEPMFKLTVFDRPTHYILWTVTQTVDAAVRQETHDTNFDEAIGSVVSQLQMAAGTGGGTP